MDYEKKYNEALERASHIKDNNTVATPQEVAEHIFPELHESEDERTRKKCMDFIRKWSSKEDRDECLAYLENQKEPLGGTFSSYEMAKTFTDGQNYVMKHPEKFGLQRPAEWSEEDEKIIDTIVSALGQYIDYKAVSGTGTGYATPRYSKEIDWLKSIRPSWKPSEEQMAALRDVITMKRAVNEFAETKLRELYEHLITQKENN